MNEYIIKLLPFVFGFLTVVKTQEQCLTPLSRNGVCANARDCSILVEWNQKYKGVLPQHLKDYLIQAKCSLDNEPIRLCCDADYYIVDRFNADLDRNGDFFSQLNKDGYNILNGLRCGPIPGNRIAGGSETILAEFPWMALLKYEGPSGHEFKCGGSLITDQYVLTAAHCVKDNVIGVRLGEYNLDTDPDCMELGGIEICNPKAENFGIEQIFRHPKYSHVKHINDIALIKLDRKVQLKNKRHIQPICLPITPEARTIPTDRFAIAGHGTTEKGYASKILLKAEVAYLQYTVCENQYESIRLNVERTKYLCAGDLQSGRDTCKGDSGGPLMRISKYKKHKAFVQYGVVANGGAGCTLSQAFPGIYTNILNYLPWITDTITK